MTILDSIIQFAVAKESDTQAYGVLVDSARYGDMVKDKESFNLLCRLGETDYMERFHHNTDGAKKKNGEWAFSGTDKITGERFISSAYMSAKSVIGSALDHGIPLVDENGKPVGKSALQRSLKEAKEGSKEEKTELEKARVMLDSVAKVAVKCNSGELDALLDSIDWLKDTIGLLR